MTKFPRRAFTLIELLVVVSIIAVIAAILFPVFSRARENARRTNCLSNAKQIALAVMQYTSDHDDTLPPVAYEDAGDEVSWREVTTPYLKNDQVFRCPSDPKSKKISYGLNELAFVDLGDEDSTLPLKLALFQTPSQTVMLGETGLGDDFKTVLPDTEKLVVPSHELDDDEDARPAIRHFDRCNLAFMDGHTKSLPLTSFYRSQTPADKFFTP